MTDRIRCRVTAHLPGGAVPGDIVLVDPNDPWMASKIGRYLVPLEPRKPPSPDEAAQDASQVPQEAAGALAAPPPAETPPEESKTAAVPLSGSEGDNRGP